MVNQLQATSSVLSQGKMNPQPLHSPHNKPKATSGLRILVQWNLSSHSTGVGRWFGLGGDNNDPYKYK